MYSLISAFYAAERRGIDPQRLKIDVGNRGSKIQEMVLNREADVGAGAYAFVKGNNEFRVIHISRKIPGSGVYLSPSLTETQKEMIKLTLANTPEQIQEEANFGKADELDYTEFGKIARRTEQLVGCSDFSQSFIRLYCPDIPNSSKDNRIHGKVNGFSLIDDNRIVFYLVNNQNKRYKLIISRLLLNQGDFPPPPGWQNQSISVHGTQPNSRLEIEVTSPKQVIFSNKY